MNSKEVVDFYNEYCRMPFLASTDREELKANFLKRFLNDNTLYKYIPFDFDDGLNSKKIFALKEEKLWYAAHYTLRNNDPTEFKVTANIARVKNSTGMSIAEIKNLLDIFREMNDVCCLSDRLHEYMWDKYANKHSGICCVFTIKNNDILFPVIYCNKNEVDFTQTLIKSIKSRENDSEAIRRLTFIPNVLKDKSKYSEEREFRLLSGAVYDSEKNPLGGKVASGKKEDIGYKGIYYSYEESGLELKKIIIGKNTPLNLIESIQTLNTLIEME